MPLDADESIDGPSQAPAKPWWLLALAGAMALVSEIVEWFGLVPDWVVAGLALLVILSADLSTYRKGRIALKNRSLNINALMNIAVTGAILIDQQPEAVMVSVLFTIAEPIEAESLDRARNAIRNLLQLALEQATVLVDGEWKGLSTKRVELEATAYMEPDERIVLDGEVTSGHSSVNQAPITGESLPVGKEIGESVFTGNINGEDALEYCVTRRADDSIPARIIHTMEEAQGSRASTQRFVDSFTCICTPVVFLTALATTVLPLSLFGGAWLDWIYYVLVLLVIACLYALVISTLVTIVSDLSVAMRLGTPVKGGASLELGRKLSWVALDKTGTITHGKPQQTNHLPTAETDETDMCLFATSLAARSDHSVSRAVANAAEEDDLALGVAEDLAALPGRGVSGRIGGVLYRLGNHRLMEGLGFCSSALEERLDALECQGKTVIALCGPQRMRALLAVTDGVKDSSREAIRELHALDMKTLMLANDNLRTATVIVVQAGIDTARGNLLSEGKLRGVEAHQTNGSWVGMVGDGINDMPVLVRADIGFAMGVAGTDAAIETAGVALVDNDLRRLLQFVRLSRITHTILVQNIILTLGIETVFFALTLADEGTLWVAVFADMGASLLVVLNGLRLLRKYF